MQILLIDYGAGNLHSVHKALLHAGLDVKVSNDPSEGRRAQALVLPGQGQFGQVMSSFRDSGFEPVVREHIEQERPFLGICVGLQLLLHGSEEAPGVSGLGLLDGMVKRFPQGTVVPQMGWNRIHKRGASPLLEGIEDGSYVYFANSYYAQLDDSLPGASTVYGSTEFQSAISRGALHAVQFHPEKSQKVGQRILRNFAEIVRSVAA